MDGVAHGIEQSQTKCQFIVSFLVPLLNFDVKIFFKFELYQILMDDKVSVYCQFSFLTEIIFSETFVVLQSNLFFKFIGDDERFQKHFFLFLSIYFSSIIILYYNFNFVAFPSSRVFTSLFMWYFYLWQTYVDIINMSFHCWLNFLACLIHCKWLAVWK